MRRDIRRLLADQAAIHGSFLPLPDQVVPNVMPTINTTVTEEPYNDRLLAQIPADSPLLGMHSLEEVATYIAEHVLVPIDQARTNPVPGVGKPDADLMVIGEAPGKDEDKKGEPFVGRAGQLLDKILDAIDFGRDDIFIANILKSRPPNNRDPEPDEIAAHLPILIRQIMLVKPKLILCVGRVAGNVLLGTNVALKVLRETRFHDFHGIPLMVTYHPAALLRSEKYKRPTWEDVKELRAKYDELVVHTSV